MTSIVSLVMRSKFYPCETTHVTQSYDAVLHDQFPMKCQHETMSFK